MTYTEERRMKHLEKALVEASITGAEHQDAHKSSVDSHDCTKRNYTRFVRTMIEEVEDTRLLKKIEKEMGWSVNERAEIEEEIAAKITKLLND